MLAKTPLRNKPKKGASVIVYTTPTCPYCIMAKDFLNKHKVRFKEIDISVNEKAAEQMVSGTGQFGVPVIKIGKKYVVGFDRPAIGAALRL